MVGRNVSQVDVSVIIAVRNEEAFLRDTAPRILDQDYPGGIEFLFVEGRSDDRSREILEEEVGGDDRARVLDNPKQDLASALNVGLRNATGEYVVQMDAHTYYPDGYVRKGVERLRRGDVAWVTGPPVPHGVDPWSRRVALALNSWLGTGGARKWSSELAAIADQDGSDREIDLDSTSVFAGFWPRALLEELGGWDERWPVNHDVELAARVRKTGGRIVCVEELGSRYVPRGTLDGLARQYYAYGYYRVLTSGRHPEALRPSQLLSPTLVLAGIAAVLGPGAIGRAARAMLAGYAAAVLATSAAAARDADPGDAAGLPAVFATMHFSWGAGFLVACATHGPPLKALARVAGRARRR
jgi:glycosyltransferase involved in cell wall biosynthesis